MTSPQTKEGKEYWDKLYKKAGELFGSENITIPTLTRPWIVPDEVIIRESPEGAYIYKATLKVMLEEDYLRETKDDLSTSLGARGRGTTINYSFNDPRLKELNEYSTQLIKESIIPRLTREINSARRYAPLRQVYYSLILAQWFKQKYGSLGSARASGTRAPVNNYIDLIDSGNLANLASTQPYDKQTYFQQYQQSFKDGEYNLQEPVYTPMGQSIRRYVSGGIRELASSSAVKIIGKSEVPQSNYFASFVYGEKLVTVSSAVDNPIDLFNGSTPESTNNYKNLPEETKEKLRQAFLRNFPLIQDEVDKILNNPPSEYVLRKDDKMFDLMSASAELLLRYPEDRIMSLGRSPLWFVEAARIIELLKNGDIAAGRYGYIAFSGRWYDEKNGFLRKSSYGPNEKQIKAFRKYLSEIGLDPKTIKEKKEKTVIVEYTQTGASLRSFIDILMDPKWAEELGVDIKEVREKIIMHILQDPVLDKIVGFGNLPFYYQEVNHELVRDLANSDRFDDSMGIHYNFDKWEDVNPLEASISKKTALVRFRIIDFLARHKLPTNNSMQYYTVRKNHSKPLEDEWQNYGGADIKGLGKEGKISSSAIDKPGGIDLSRINKSIRVEGVASPGVGSGGSPVDVDFDLNEELGRLQNLLNAEIIPSASRLDRYARAVCASSASSPDSADSALSLIAETFRLQEEKAVSAPAELKALAAWMEKI